MEFAEELAPIDIKLLEAGGGVKGIITSISESILSTMEEHGISLETLVDHCACSREAVESVVQGIIRPINNKHEIYETVFFKICRALSISQLDFLLLPSDVEEELDKYEKYLHQKGPRPLSVTSIISGETVDKEQVFKSPHMIKLCLKLRILGFLNKAFYPVKATE